MDVHPCDEVKAVKVGIVLYKVSEGENCVVISREGCGVDYRSGKNEEAESFCFDQVVTEETIQSLHPELLQPLTEAVSTGYNGALLTCGASNGKMSTLMDNIVIKQVIESLFTYVMSAVKEEVFISVSFLQFHPDGNAEDVLSPERKPLKLVTHPVLGNVITGLREVCVCSAEEAFALYETCRDTLKVNTGSISSRCSWLFSVAVEWRLDPAEMESEVCRSRLQLFSLAGGASRSDLRGVSPLVKILDQVQNQATVSDAILPLLLNDALTGNSRTVLLYCLRSQGPLDETPAALTLALKARSLHTKAVVGRWSPRTTEQQMRDVVMLLRAAMMSQGENEVHNSYRLAELNQNLQIVKNQSWEKRRDESKRIKEKEQSCRTTNVKRHSSDLFAESTETIKYLQQRLNLEMEEHIREGKGSSEKVHERVATIQQLRESIREEKLKTGGATEKSDLCQHPKLEYNRAEERRRQLKEHHGRLIQEEVEKMERDLAQEQLPTEGPQRELRVLTRERQVLVLQLEALRAEAQQAEKDLQDQYERQQMELHCLREESLQVFRVFRQVSEEQSKVSEGRYRQVLLEAVQDAVYLSAQNQELQADNKQLRKALGELKDTRAARGDPSSESSSQQR